MFRRLLAVFALKLKLFFHVGAGVMMCHFTKLPISELVGPSSWWTVLAHGPWPVLVSEQFPRWVQNDSKTGWELLGYIG